MACLKCQGPLGTVSDHLTGSAEAQHIGIGTRTFQRSALIGPGAPKVVLLKL